MEDNQKQDLIDSQCLDKIQKASEALLKAANCKSKAERKAKEEEARRLEKEALELMSK